MSNKSQFIEYQPLVYSTLHKLRVPRPYDDYVQEAYFVYEKCRHNYDPSLSKFSSYFTLHLLYYYKSLFRKKKKPLLAFVPSLHTDPLLDVITLWDITDHCHLTNVEKDVLFLTLKDWTIKEISCHIDRSPSTIKRARRSIRKKISPYVRSQ
ncbi:sigma-70 family RNA polymerase sigma factor [Halobacillus sp. Marseille-Q1614]|uniref:sigma-70 family RNA polymerase sigma factor n=1 Tax=Halobacillus sp. Marseille-Q1614 TaxID=2709134 RepID=UPI00156E192D|nr:sigma-70 family RNA polymerase sigma factor [Halobacillus sp. Marseille-Q1614]